MPSKIILLEAGEDLFAGGEVAGSRELFEKMQRQIESEIFSSSSATTTAATASATAFTAADLETMIQQVTHLMPPISVVPDYFSLFADPLPDLQQSQEPMRFYTSMLFPVPVIRPDAVVKLATCEGPGWIPVRRHRWDGSKRHLQYHLRVQKKWNKRFGMKWG